MHADPSVYPTGTTRYDSTRAYNSFVLFTGASSRYQTWHDGLAATIVRPAMAGDELDGNSRVI